MIRKDAILEQETASNRWVLPFTGSYPSVSGIFNSDGSICTDVHNCMIDGNNLIIHFGLQEISGVATYSWMEDGTPSVMVFKIQEFTDSTRTIVEDCTFYIVYVLDGDSLIDSTDGVLIEKSDSQIIISSDVPISGHVQYF